jgi:hypothetical protein
MDMKLTINVPTRLGEKPMALNAFIQADGLVDGHMPITSVKDSGKRLIQVIVDENLMGPCIREFSSSHESTNHGLPV